jgi:NADH:flavin oxidoreductase / NADH oxidase family
MTLLFDPLAIRDITFANRVFVSPMCQYSSTNGCANDWHYVHLGSRAVGGAGLVLTEAAAVLPEGRISPHHLLTGKIPQHGQRFDLTSEGNGYEPRMCELVTACCDPNPSARPTMQEVLQMLRGKPWACSATASTSSAELNTVEWFRPFRLLSAGFGTASAQQDFPLMLSFPRCLRPDFS